MQIYATAKIRFALFSAINPNEETKMATKKVNTKEVMAFINTGVSEQAVANRFGLTVEEVYDITMGEKQAERYDSKYKMKFAKEWNAATEMVLKGLKKKQPGN